MSFGTKVCRECAFGQVASHDEAFYIDGVDRCRGCFEFQPKGVVRSANVVMLRFVDRGVFIPIMEVEYDPRVQ